MSIGYTILSFVVALGLLITFHELGHYLIARLNGVKVLRFSIGFGQPIFRKRLGKDQTEWVVAAIPLGGYVKMLDENEGSVAPHELSRSFNRQPVARRFAIVAAGPIANFLLAIILYWLLFVLGVSDMKPILGPVEPNTPAAHAQFEAGETIVRINNEPIESWQDARWVLLRYAIDQSDKVNVETINKNGEINSRKMDFSQIDPDKLSENFSGVIGFTSFQPSVAPIIDQVVPDSAGYYAGLSVGDEILAINDVEIYSWAELVQQIRNNPEQLLKLDILRNEQIITLSITPEAAQEKGKQIGKIGIAPRIDRAEFDKILVKVSYPPIQALLKAFEKLGKLRNLLFACWGKW